MFIESKTGNHMVTVNNKGLSILSMIIVAGSVFQEDKYYPQICSHECLYDFVNEWQSM